MRRDEAAHSPSGRVTVSCTKMDFSGAYLCYLLPAPEPVVHITLLPCEACPPSAPSEIKVLSRCQGRISELKIKHENPERFAKLHTLVYVPRVTILSPSPPPRDKYPQNPGKGGAVWVCCLCSNEGRAGEEGWGCYPGKERCWLQTNLGSVSKDQTESSVFGE